MAKDFILICDSTADLPVEVIEKLNVDIIPFSYSIGEDVYQYYLSKEDGDISEFYEKLKTGAMPSTSQINPETYMKHFEKYVKEGKDILYLSFSSGLSGSYQTSLLGVDLLKDTYPDANVIVIDSLCASIGEGILLYLVAKKKEEGASIEELEQWILSNRNNIRHWFMVEDLFHLKRGGRISTVEAVVGSALKIKPILSVDDEGKLFVKSKTRGVLKALEYISAKLDEEACDYENQVAVIGHADAIDNALKLKEMVVSKGIKPENIMIAPIGPIIGTHVGAGMVALTFLKNI